MLRLRAAIISIAIAAFPGCGTPGASINQSLRGGVPLCSAQHKLDGLHVYLHVDGRWQDYVGGRTPPTSAPFSTGDRVPRNDPGLNDASVRFPKAFPEQARIQVSGGGRLGFPAAYSPDRQSFAAAMLTDSRDNSADLLIRSRIERKANSLPGFHFYNIVWSPDSKRIALLEMRNDPTPRSIKALVAPHRVDYSDAILTVIDVNGNPICQAALVEKQPDLMGRMEWRA